MAGSMLNLSLQLFMSVYINYDIAAMKANQFLEGPQVELVLDIQNTTKFIVMVVSEQW